MYYRHDPIIVGSPPAKPPNDYSYSKAVMRSALLFDALVTAGVPDVKAVWAHEIGGARMFTVVAITQRYAGHARQAGHILNQPRDSALDIPADPLVWLTVSSPPNAQSPRVGGPGWARFARPGPLCGGERG